MRSGQYKLSWSKGSASDDPKVSVNSFRPSLMELPPLLDLLPPGSHLSEELNFFHLTMPKDDEERGERKDTALRNLKEQFFKFDRQRDSFGGLRQHRSCENVSSLSRGAVNRVEQKVRSLLLRGDTKKRNENMFTSCGDFVVDGSTKADLWQAGKIVTMSRKSRLTSAYSHSALHTLNGTSDTASCLSASSGYSSSSSSSYGSFKSNASVCSTLPRNPHNSPGSQSPNSDCRLLVVDNPLYDISPIPATDLSDRCSHAVGDGSGLEGQYPGKFTSVDPTLYSLSYHFEDPFAKKCKDYFERRLQTSETLRRKWSLCLSKTRFCERDKHFDSDLISKGDAIVDSKFNTGFGLEMSFGAESNFIPPEDSLEHICESKRTQLDVKMDFLRQEIASLIQQDNSLFRQLLALHDSISTLKVQNALGHAYSNAQAPLRPPTPSDLDSFTEENEELDDEEMDERRTRVDCNFHGSDMDRQGGRNGDVTVMFRRQGQRPPATGEKSLLIREEDMRSPDYKKDLEEDEDEGHGTDLSIGHTPSHSPSPASTLSSNSSKNSSYLRSLYSEMTSEFGGSFTRCRKSYAPNARNRRRASSVHRQKSSHLECGTTTALVVIHADDEDALLNSNRPRAHSFTPLTVFASHAAALSYSHSKGETKQSPNRVPLVTKDSASPSSKTTPLKGEKSGKERKNPSKTLNSCSSQTAVSSSLCGSSRPNLSHPPYREALIM